MLKVDTDNELLKSELELLKNTTDLFLEEDNDEIDLDTQYIIEIIVANEQQQEELYNEMQYRGLECRVLKL